MDEDYKQHWEKVYKTKNPDQVSWTQEKPQISLEFIESLNLSKNAKIIDVGGGESKLVDFLLDFGYENITVLDISSTALEKTKIRLGKRASKVKWITSNIVDFQPEESYELWHDRATFHFLTQKKDIQKYIEITSKYVSKVMIIGTFSKSGPEKCSGLNIKQYSCEELEKQFQNNFKILNCVEELHKTPFDTIQNFIFCSFKKNSKP